MRAPWQDRLAQAKAGGAAPGTATITPAAVAQAPQPDPTRFAPGLRALIDERAKLEQQMAALTGPPPDPRYAVAPMADRRAEFARWSAARDGTRPEADAAPTALRWPGDRVPQLRGTPGEMLRATPGELLRATPGEAVPAGRVPIDPAKWSALRDTGGALSDAGRALAGPGEGGGGSAGDPLDRRLARARDLASRSRRAYAAAERALAGAKQAIPDDWAERARERVPGLGRADPYVRETAKKLAVVVGTLEEMGDKADQLRETASAVRELKAADEAGDDARRDRALDRLKAKRAQGDSAPADDAPPAPRPRETERPRAKASDDAPRAKARPEEPPRAVPSREAAVERPRARKRDPDPPLPSDRLRARREAADA